MILSCSKLQNQYYKKGLRQKTNDNLKNELTAEKNKVKTYVQNKISNDHKKG